jgi:hypothetical protein
MYHVGNLNFVTAYDQSEPVRRSDHATRNTHHVSRNTQLESTTHKVQTVAVAVE